MTPQKIFIGVAWPYVNGDLHPGHIAGNFLPADIFARFQRLIGNSVLMVSGSDCYGTPTTVEADKLGISPQAVVDKHHPNHLKLIETYGISFDLYTKTTTENHKQLVQELFLKLAENNYLFKDRVRQYYSPEDNKFLPDRYVEGECGFCGFVEARGDQCENCGRVLDSSELKNPVSKLSKSRVILKETEHLFFDLPKLQNFLQDYVELHKFDWKSWIYQEVIGWLKKGLKPRAITRDLTWGIEIPNDKLPQELQIDNVENKRIYVWFEAVVGYLSAARQWGKNWQEFWYAENKNEVKMYNFMGKDNVVFHALFWPAQLWGAYKEVIKLPDVIAANQYLNIEGKKFSKSRGLTIDSIYIAQKYGVDVVRFYLTYIMPEEADANFSWAHFVEFNNKVLIGTFANFINRVLKLSEGLNFTQVESCSPDVAKAVEKYIVSAWNKLANCQFKQYCHTVIELADYGNKYINKEAPWKLDKKSQEYKRVLLNNLFIVLSLSLTIEPLIPKTNKKLQHMLGIKIDKWVRENVVEYLSSKLAQIKLNNPEPLFTKIDPDAANLEKAKLNLS